MDLTGRFTVRARTGRSAPARVEIGRHFPRVLLAISVLLSVTACGGSSVSKDERARAVSAAQAAYATARANGADFRTGPCIAEQLADLPDWSVDVAHDPREDVDNQPANQCRAYRQGKTHHFVELDPNGILIRTH